MKTCNICLYVLTALCTFQLVTTDSFAKQGESINRSYSAGEFFVEKEIVWFGLDFSFANMIGDFSNFTGEQIRDELFPAWNNLVLKEPHNFDLKKVFRKSSVIYDLSVVTARNKNTDPDSIFTTGYARKLGRTSIEKVVAEYKDAERTSGLGLVFIVNYFSKESTLASLNVVVFDISSLKVLFIEEVSGEPGGFGLRNFWAGSIKEILKSVNYRSWRRKYKQ